MKNYPLQDIPKIGILITVKQWDVSLLRNADKQLQKLPKAIQDIVLAALEDLEAEGPLPKHWDVKKTSANEYRLRINYRYRMRYKVERAHLIIQIFYLGHRKDAYK